MALPSAEQLAAAAAVQVAFPPDPGVTGPQGPQGVTGPTGPAGSDGAQGAQGVTGPQGEPGQDGAAGADGAEGPQGPAGVDGLTGPQGEQGPTGETGPQGIVGDTGVQGIPGETGPQGAAGVNGTTGPQGRIGSTGPQGIRGDTGATGAQGVVGPTGVTGPTGTRGTPGTDGTSAHVGDGKPPQNLGRAGDSYVDQRSGDLYARTDRWRLVGNLRGPPGSAGPAGAGARGATGATGPGGGGSGAGSPGTTGPTGVTGVAGTPGLSGPTGAAGSGGATGPAGLSGAAGLTGVQGVTGVGATGSVGVTGITGPAGATGPAGSTGAGVTGATGTPGATGPAGLTGTTGPAGTVLSLNVNQAAHSLAVQDVIRLSGGTYVKAQADSVVNAEVVGIVSAVADASNFTVTTNGHVSGLSGLSAGTVYFLSDATAGLLTATEPSAAGSVSKPLLIADTTTSGYLFVFRGSVVGAGTTPGLTGATGPAGVTGATGPAGANGSTGVQGVTGVTGTGGVTGVTGPAGATGTADPNTRIGRAKHGGTVDYQLPGVVLTSTSTVSPSTGTVYYFFCWTPTAITIDQLAFNVTTGPSGAAKVRVGIYAVDTDSQPTGAPLADVEVAVASAFTGIKTATVSAVVGPGTFLVAVNMDVGMTFRTWRGNSVHGFIDNSLGTNTNFGEAFGTQAYPASFPNPGTAWATTVGGTVEHWVVARVSVP